MRLLTILSRLLDYPSQEIKDNAAELVAMIREDKNISPAVRQQLIELVDDVYQRNLMDAQETYSELFDRGRHLSLLLFEHVHGESRDRGQAMVDLMGQYQTAGFNINVKELPDYIPLYLEFLGTRDEMEARVGLADVAHIFGLLSARLEERESPYAAVFNAMLQISGVKVDAVELREQVQKEERDDSLEALDKIWEEEAITFGMGDNVAGADACPTNGMTSGLHKAKQPIAEAVRFVDAAQ